MSGALESHRSFFEQSRIPLRLACLTRQGWPLVVSLWFLNENENIYCATQQSAKIISHLRHNSRCGFEIAGDRPPYRGVRGQGEAALRPELGPAILERLIERYLNGTQTPLGKNLLAHADKEIAIEIRPLRIFAWDFTRRMKESIAGTTS
jgi:nitroimidazol reductase NimA-like FMN-containing flavoprotein (pyridoxamine 5'-phosphate oxidase superfamily)